MTAPVFPPREGRDRNSRTLPSACTAALLLAGVSLFPGSVQAGEQPHADPRSGIQTQFFDRLVRPQDDFYQYVNGGWLAATDIPPGRPAYGAAAELYADAQRQLASILATLETTGPSDADSARLLALYQSFMDEAHVEALGTVPLHAEFARIAALRSRSDLPGLIAHLQRIGCLMPLRLSVQPDPTETTHYAANLQQDGLELPDRDYYLPGDDTGLRLVRERYQQYVESSLRRLGDRRAAAETREILALETRIARAQWNRTDSADPLKTYHPMPIAHLRSLGKHFGWRRYLDALGAGGRVDTVIVSEPDYLRAFDQAIADVPLPAWKAYFRWHLLADYSPDLPHDFSGPAFEFFSGTLQGIVREPPRKERALALVNAHLAQSLGRLYVARYFPLHSKQRAQQLVQNLLLAMRNRIDSLSWLGPQSRREAMRKLGQLVIKIGYPDRWRDYSALQIHPDDLIGNIMRANAFEFDLKVSRLGLPIDRSEWDDAPQTVNAYYSPLMNEIVFPAAILRPPFFDASVDDAVNYGAIGMVIGHELSHAFDAEGARYDSAGRLRDWWTPEEHARFDALVQPLVREYGDFEPLRGRHIDGVRTLRENAADNAGLAIAYAGYHLALNGHEAPILAGMTGNQRFFIGFAQAWREKIRDSAAIEMIQSDPHALSYVRVLGTLMNQPAFYTAFDLAPGDRLYLPPASRVSLW